MATIKSYSDLQQSKKLAEILPIGADYHYITQGKKSYFYPYSLSSDAIKDYDEEIKYIPCWSLAALLNVLLEYHLSSPNPLSSMHCCRVNDIETYASNPVNACMAMIEKLHELKML